jgi:L-lactate dehydrogenase
MAIPGEAGDVSVPPAYVKIAVIGVGAVGATIAYALMISGLASEILLIDVNEARAEGEAMDLMHGLPFVRPVTVRSGKYEDCAGAQIVVIAAGVAQKPGETRLELVKKNVAIFRQMVPQITAAAPGAVLLVVSNPVDILTYATNKISGFPARQVLGSGTVLDTARLRTLIGQHLRIDSRSVHANVVGEHGDSEVVVWSRASIAGMPLADFCRQRGSPCEPGFQAEITQQVSRAAYEIINRKGATYYAIGLGVRQIVEAILRDQDTVFTVSTLLHGQLGIDDVCLSLPCVVDRGGVDAVLEPSLDDGELAALKRSAALLYDTAREAGL